MSSSELKKLLRTAKEAVKSKDYANTISTCNEILKLDKDHYMALVMMAAAYQATDSKEAAKHLKHAARVGEDPTIALQGLCLCVDPPELPEIIRQLLQRNPEKYSDLHSKLVTAASVSNKVVNEITPFVELLRLETDCDGARRTSALHSLAAIYVSNAGCSANDSWQHLFFSALEHAINSPTDQQPAAHELYKAFLKLAHKLGKISELLDKARQMHANYPSDEYSLEWICKVFVEQATNDCGGLQSPPKLQVDIDAVAEVSSTFVLMARAIYWFQAGNFVQSRDLLLKVNVSQLNWKCCQLWLAKVYAKFGAHSLCEMLLQRLQIADLTLVLSLVEQNDQNKMDTAIGLCKQLLPTAELTQQCALLSALAKAMMKKGNYGAAEKTIQKLIALDQLDLANLLFAEYYRVQKLYAKSLELLVDNPLNSCDYFLQLGQSRYALGQLREALDNLRKATKLQPNNSHCFYWLGRVYYDLADHNLAMKCLEKCCYLHPHHRDAVTLLSGIYRGVRNYTSNNSVLQSAAHPIPGFTSTTDNWVGVLLGLHHLALGEFNEAIASFRSALRSDADNIGNWEGLADAYLERGSFSSALRVYQKISELDGCNPYPKLQVANVKCKLRMHREAVESFAQLLAEHPKLVPGLKGMAESHMGLSYHCNSQRLLARSKFHAGEAVKYLIEAIQLRSDLAVLWRMLASALELIASLPGEHAHLEVPGTLAGVATDNTTIAGDQLFELSARCLCRAIRIASDDVLLWYELALSYYTRASRYGANGSARKNLDLALETAKHTVKLMPGRWLNWNLMGVICATGEINQLALAQHCFIKALQLNKKSAVPWTNLGVLYLQQGELKLANKVFGRAQQAETDFVHGWNGQACIAEIMGEKDEAMDLFKHCTQLQYSAESALGFAHFVCLLLSDPKAMQQSRYRFIVERMHAVPSALDSIEWFCKAEADDATLESLCFLGYLYHQQRLWKNAIRAFRRAADKAIGVVKDKMLCNLGLCYLKNDEPEEAINVFHSVAEATFAYTIGLAYSHFKAKQFQESYAVYESALNLLASSDSDKAMILVAMSAMVYTFQGVSDAKSFIYQCIGLPDPPVAGLFSGCAIGILHNETQLVQLVLQELQKHKHNILYTHHIAFFTAQFYLQNNKRQKALAYLQSQVHCYPDNVHLRKVLTNFILHNYRGSEKVLTGASRLAESITLLQLTDLKCDNSSMEGAKSLAMASEAMRYVNQNIRKQLAQRAVHMNPTCKEAWAALITCNQ